MKIGRLCYRISIFAYIGVLGDTDKNVYSSFVVRIKLETMLSFCRGEQRNKWWYIYIIEIFNKRRLGISNVQMNFKILNYEKKLERKIDITVKFKDL